MKNKLLKILSVVLCIIVAVALFFTVTRVADVTVSVKNAQTLNAADIEESLSFKWVGENIILMDKQAIATHLSLAFPAVKVEGVVKNFPNHITVHVTERKPLFAVKTVLGFDFIDEEGVFLSRNPENVYNGFSGMLSLSLSQNENVPGTIYEAGEVYSAVFRVLSAARKYGYDGKELAALFSEISVTGSAITLQSKPGVRLMIEEYSVETEKKVQYLLSAFVACNDSDKTGGTLVVYADTEGKIVVDTRGDALKIS